MGEIKELMDLEVKNYYIINQDIFFMTEHLDRYGNQYTLVYDISGFAAVNRSSLAILDDSIRCIGFDLRGALETSKWLLDQPCMCPVMINPIERIVLFPTRSPHHEENIWFNPHHIKRTIGINGKTKILFSDGTSLTIPTRLSSFNSKLQRAEQLKSLTIDTADKPFTFVLIPKKKKRVRNKNLDK